MMLESSEKSGKVQEVIDRCRNRGLRCTKLVKLTIEHFVNAESPLTAKEIVGSENIADSFDPASVYRLITRLEQIGIVRRLGLWQERAVCYALQDHDHCDDYIVCTVCGVIKKLEMDCPIASIENAIAKVSGYQNLEHELKFFGICPDCPAAAS